MKEQYHDEKKLRQQTEKKVQDLEIKCAELQNFADANAQKFKEQLEINMKR